MKIIKNIALTLVVLLIVVGIAVSFFLGGIIKTAVETAGPAVAGVEMTLDKASVKLLRGKINLKGLVIGNPEGFKTPSLMELSELVIDIDIKSLATDTIVIKQIHIDGPQITYERALKASNISKLQDNLAVEEPKDEPKEEKEASTKPAKKVIIDDFLLENGKINISITLAGGKQMTIPLPTLHLEDIGKESDGASIAVIIKEVTAAISKAIVSAVTSSADFVGDAAGAAVGLVGDGAGAAVGVASDAAGAIGDGAGAAAGAAADAAKGAVSGLKKLGGGLFK